MPIHEPKRESTKVGLGLPNTTKQLAYNSPDHATLTEVWNDMPNGAWHQDDIVIAEPGYTWVSDWHVGQPYVITQFFDASMNLVGTYIDITRPVRKVSDAFEYDDLYLDIWQVPGRRPEILDRDDLNEAVSMGFVSAADARRAEDIAQQIVRRLSDIHS